MGGFLEFITAILLALFLGILAGEGSVKITATQFKVAKELCAEREVEWVSQKNVQCKDGSIYENYNKEK